MAEFRLGQRPNKTLAVVCGEDVYHIPLQGSLPVDVAAHMDTQFDTVEKTLEFFRRYLPEDIMEGLSLDDYNALVNTWVEESQKASKMTVGE